MPSPAPPGSESPEDKPWGIGTNSEKVYLWLMTGKVPPADREFATPQAKRRKDAALAFCLGAIVKRGIVHHVADRVDAG